MVRKLFIKIIIAFHILILALLLPAQIVKAETLEEQLNNLTGPKKQYNTALSPVYLRNNASEESISTQSGDLSLNQTDYVLPGKNGLDLEIKRLYKSGISNVQEMKVKYVDGAWVDYVYSDANTTSFYEERYNLGIGMRFSFPAMEFKTNSDGTSYKYLHTEAGDVYRLADPTPTDGVEAYEPEGQTVKDVAVTLSTNFSNGQTDGKSKYVMTGKDGRKTYFSDDGRVLGIVDRYGNTIKFEYDTLSYTADGTTKTRKLATRITDTVGRVVTIEYKEDASYTVGPIKNTVYSADESYKNSQNPNTLYSGDLDGKFQVIVHLPDGKKITYDKTAVLVSSAKHVLRTRLQRVYDLDGKPKYHFWYEQPSLGFSYTEKITGKEKTGKAYSAYNTYENLVQVDYCRNNRIKRYTYNTSTKSLSDGSMQYRKIFEKKELAKTGYDTTKTDFLDRFVCEVKDRLSYSYTNEPDGYDVTGYQENDDTYLKNGYKYYTTKTDMNSTTAKYTYNGKHELVVAEETGTDHKKVTATENDEMKFPKKVEETLYNITNGQVGTQYSKKIENFRYDQYGNLTSYTGPLAKRDTAGYPVDTENTVIYSYACDKFHTLLQKTWKQDKDTSCQIINTVDEKGNITKEQKVNTGDPSQWVNTDYQYDSSGNVTQKTVNSQDNTYITKYVYGTDADGGDHKGAYLTKEYNTVNGAELARQYVYDHDTGNKLAEIDENGNRTDYGYDELERNIKITYPDKTFREYVYKDYSSADREVEYLDPRGTKFLFTYDIFDNIVRYSVKDEGLWKTLAQSEYDFRGNTVSETDSNGNKITFDYDSNNRLIAKNYYEKSTVKKESIKLTYTLGVSDDVPLLLTLADEDGYVKRYYYNAAEQLVKYEETPGNKVFYTQTYAYNYTGAVSSETDAKSATTTYLYDNLGRLSRKIDALNNETTYTYNNLDDVLTEEAPGGKITGYFYDSAGRRTEARTYTKGSNDYYYEKYTYDNAGNITASAKGKVENGQDSLSAKSEFTYDNMDRVTDEYSSIEEGRKSHIHYVYDADGNRIETDEYADQAGDKLLKYTYAYDFAGELISEDGIYTENGSQGSAATHGTYMKKYTWDCEGNLLKEEQYDGSGFQTTEYAYDYRNRLVLKTEPYSSDGKNKQTAYTYDKRGNTASETVTIQGTACTTAFRYDGRGKLVQKTDAMKHTTTYLYDENGNLKKEIDPRYYGQNEDGAPGMEYEYDSLGRLVKAASFDGTNREVVFFKEYDGRGNVIKEADAIGYDSNEPTLSTGKKYEYDAAGNVIRYTSARMAKDGGSSTGYTRIYTYNGSGMVTSEQDSNGEKTVKTYYLNGLLKAAAYPDGSSEAYSYDDTGKVYILETDRGGNKTATYNNIFGKPYRVEYPDRTSETFEYTAEGYEKESRDRNGNITQFEYDPAGNMTARKEYEKSDADTVAVYYRLTRFSYDENGQVLSSETFSLKAAKADGRVLSSVSAGDRTESVYDKAGRLAAAYGPNGRETLNSYDAAGNITAVKQKVSDKEYKVQRFTYDTRSRKVSEALLLNTADLDKKQLQGATFDDEYPTMVLSTTSYTYYANDLIKSTKDAAGNETLFEYDLDGQLVKKEEPLHITTTYAYDTEGNLIRETDGRGVTCYYEYDSMDRMIRQKAPASGGGLAVTRYIFDAMGNLLKVIQPNRYEEAKDTQNQANGMQGVSYTYDSMNRQTSIIAPTGETVQYISYDAGGNVKKSVDGLRYQGSTGEGSTVEGNTGEGSTGDSKGTVYEYDGLNRVVRVTDALGGITAMEYDVLDNITKQTDALEHATSYEYNPDGTLARVTYPDQGTVSFTCDLLGRVTGRTDQRGNTSAYTYNAFDKPKEEKDPYGSSIVHKYDLKGNECATTDKRGSTVYTSYDALDRPVEKKTPLEQDGTGNLLYSIESYTYDEAGNLLTRTVTGPESGFSPRIMACTYYGNNLLKSESDNNGAYVIYSYDNNGNLTKKETLREVSGGTAEGDTVEGDTADGGTDSNGADNTSAGNTSTDSNGADNTGTDSNGADSTNADNTGSGSRYDTELYVYDAMDRLTQSIRLADREGLYNVSDIDNLESLIDNKYPGKVKLITGYAYDILGNKTAETSPTGYGFIEGDDINREKYTVRYSYDALNRLEKVTRKYNGADVSVRYTYDAAGNRLEEENERGYVTKYAYDVMNRLTAITDPDGYTLTYGYDLAGNRITVTNAKGHTITYSYDLLNREENVTDACSVIISRKLYDKNGNMIKAIEAKGYLSASGDDARYGTVYTYDLANRLTGMAKPEAAAQGKTTETYKYNVFGEQIKVTDALGNATAYEYDNGGNLVKVTDALGITTTYGYDKAGSKLYLTDGRGKTTNYSYNSLGKMSSMTDAENRTVSYQYDLAGNLACVTDRNDTVTLYTYDSRNLLLEKKINSTTDCSVTYTYDEVGNKSGMTDESGKYIYSYDAENQLAKISKAGNTQIAYTYDELGNIASITDSLGFTTDYTFDKSSRMETVTYAGQTVTYTYDKNGNRESVTYSTGVTEEFKYDRDNKLLKMTNSKADGSILSSFSYTYDLTGRQLTKKDSYGTTTYTYDSDGRILREETPGRTAVCAYDNAGNRVTLNETYTSEQPTGFIDSASEKEIKYILKKSEYVYSASNRLMKLVEKLCEASGKVLLTKTTMYLYDGNGNQLRQSTSYTALSSIKARQTLKGTSYGDSLSRTIDPLINRTSNTFDGFNRLKKTEQIQSGVRTLVEYTYNGDDLRVKKTVKKSDNGYTPDVTVFLYDRQHVILETEADGSLKTRYIRGINYLARAGSSGGYSTILYNGHGDVVQTVNEAGDIQNSYDYDIWGNPTLTLEQYSFSIRYAGEFFDKETGLYYLRARYYNPYIGRFISEDSYWGEDENPLSLNLYTYCSNDPIRYLDPTGHRQAGDEKLSITDRAAIADLTYTYNEAKAKSDIKGMEAAHQAAENIRKNAANNKDSDDSDDDSSSSGTNGNDSASTGEKNKTSKKSGSGKVTMFWEGYTETVDADEVDFYKERGYSVVTSDNIEGCMDVIEQLGNKTNSKGSSQQAFAGSLLVDLISSLVQTYGSGADQKESGSNVEIGSMLSDDIVDDNIISSYKSAIMMNGTIFASRDSDDISGYVNKANDNYNAASITKYFILGIMEAMKDTITDAIYSLSHIKETVIGIGFLSEALKNPNSPAGMILQQMIIQSSKQLWNEFSTGDANKKARIIGKATGEVLIAVVGTKGASAAGKVMKSGSLFKKFAPILKNTSKADEIVESIIKSEGAAVTKGTSNAIGRYSGNLVQVNKADAAADALANRIGGQSRVKFVNDSVGREFDVVSSEYIGQTKPALQTVNKSVRDQMKATFEAAQETGRKVYYHFEGQPAQSVINKLNEYSQRYGIDVVIDTNPLMK
jgi:RHS repeat-associated protein